ncbi:helix-turn-helix domain-containing protein [Plantibacter sp. Mn2098]|uniref:helix-turn-helix domain-containing protein n=1 Tax=Plantibacter sp. Mn2098 TaxID=3395266 RepID=UPI003BB9CF05
MSYKATNWAYELPITGPQKFVLVALADMADEESSCYPGQPRLAQMTGFSVATVRRALDKLEDRGLIEREHRHGAFGYRTSDRYHLKLDVSVAEPLPLTVPTGHSAFKADSPSLPLTQSIPTSHSDGAVEPSVEPPEEPPVVIDPFERFWKVYPRKVKKADAKRAYRKALKVATPEEILAGLAAYTKTIQGKEPEFIAHASTWLNGERWDDDYGVAAPTSAYDRSKEFRRDDYS